MTINLIKKIEDDKNVTYIQASDLQLIVKEGSPTWNNDSINEFLIAVATRDPEGKLNIEFDENEEDQIYKFIVSLFIEFKKSYNNE